jgi:hypothetical protein
MFKLEKCSNINIVQIKKCSKIEKFQNLKNSEKPFDKTRKPEKNQ